MQVARLKYFLFFSVFFSGNVKGREVVRNSLVTVYQYVIIRLLSHPPTFHVYSQLHHSSRIKIERESRKEGWNPNPEGGVGSVGFQRFPCPYPVVNRAWSWGKWVALRPPRWGGGLSVPFNNDDGNSIVEQTQVSLLTLITARVLRHSRAPGGERAGRGGDATTCAPPRGKAAEL